MTPSSDIYCPDTYSIFHLEIQKRVQLIEEYYPPSFAEFISICLNYDPEERGGLPDLLQNIEEMRQEAQGGQNNEMMRRQS